MTCPRCHGCLVPEPQDDPLPDTRRCLNCGWREDVVLRTPEPERRGCHVRQPASVCVNGHAYTDENTGTRTVYGRAQRQCKRCLEARGG